MIPVSEPVLGPEELKYVIDCIKTNWISSAGAYINRFERLFAEFCRTKYAVATSNGTTALHLVLESYGIGAGDEVIVPTLTFIATANAVKYTGATPVFVDSETDTWNIDPAKIAGKITPRTKAIIPVHLYGHPANMDPIIELGRKRDLKVIEDAAEAHGAEYKGARVGSIGDSGCFSFYGNKIISTGEGGMVTTNDERLAEKATILRDHAMDPDKRYWHNEIGFNYRMTNIQAAIGVGQMEKIDYLIEKKIKHAELYNDLLAGVPGIVLPSQASWAKNVYWMYSVLVSEDYPLDRNGLMNHLKENGVDSRPFFYPIHQMPPYRTEEEFPVADMLSATGINLPSAASLKEEEINMICEIIRNV